MQSPLSASAPDLIETKNPDRSLGLFDATMIVAGSMIGSGIFIVGAGIARQLGSGPWLLAVWAATGVLTIVAAMCYGELAAMTPKAGGQYVYIRDAFGPLTGFLFGWTTFLVIETGIMAAVSIAFAKFFAVLFPWAGENHVLFFTGGYTFTATQAVALVALVILTAVNIRGVAYGKWLQNVFTVTKITALTELIVLGFYKGFGGTIFHENMQTGWNAFRLVIDKNKAIQQTPLHNGALWSAFGLAIVGAIFSSSAWNNITYTAAEIRRPERNIPLALFFGTLLTSILYVSANIAYLSVLPVGGTPGGASIAFAANDRVGGAAAEALFGAPGAIAMAVLIMISTFGCVNGITLSGARVYYAMAKDGLFFRKAAQLNRSGAPGYALAAQCVWACLLCASGKYADLLKYVTFATLLFYILTIAGIFRLRATRPDAPRPYRAIGYPVVPALYILAAGAICVNLLIYETPINLFGWSVKPSWAGVFIVLAGVPAYYLQKNRSAS